MANRLVYLERAQTAEPFYVNPARVDMLRHKSDTETWVLVGGGWLAVLGSLEDVADRIDGDE